jgi:hypothetical protein
MFNWSFGSKDRSVSDTTYDIFQDEQAYRVRISRLGEFVQEAEGFSSRTDAEAWIAQAQRLGVIRADQQKPIYSPHLRVV